MADDLSISFDVSARLEQLELAMKRAEGIARAGGERMGKAQADGMAAVQRYANSLEPMKAKAFFSGEESGRAFAAGFERADPASKIEKQLTNGLKKFLVLGAADSALRGLADAIANNKSWTDAGITIGERLFEGLKSVPIVGAFGELGTAIGNGIGDGIAEMLGASPGRAGYTVDKAASANVARLDAMSRSMSMENLNPIERMRAEFENEMASLGTGGDETTRNRIASVRAQFDARERKMLDDMRNQREVAAYREQEADDKRRAEYQVEAIARKAKDDASANRRAISGSIDARRESLGMVGDELGMLGGITASRFIERRDTALGAFSFAQQGADKTLADTSVKMLELTKRQTELLQEIKNLQAESAVLQ